MHRQPQLLAVSIMRALPLLSTLESVHQGLDTPSLASFQKYDEGIQSQIEVDDRLWTSKGLCNNYLEGGGF